MYLVKNENLEWNLPILSLKNFMFLDNFIKEISEIDDINPIKYIHGNIVNRWAGGEQPEIIDISDFNFPNSVTGKQVTPVITFSKYNVTDEDLKEKAANMLLDKAIKEDAEFEVSSDKLYDYIKSRYPNAKLIASPVKSAFELEKGKEVEFYKKLLEKYDRIVLSSEYVKNGLIDFEKIGEPEKFEIIVNNRCFSNCPLLCEHLTYNEQIFENEFPNCPQKTMSLKDLYNLSLALSTDEIENIYKTTGINKFRIIGQHLKFQDLNFLVLDYILKRYGANTFFIFKQNSYNRS